MDDWKHTGRTVVKPRECLLSTLSVWTENNTN